MALPTTNDSQKVSDSAVEKFRTFVGAVEKVSNTPHMNELYDNMTKLFDAFTNGALTMQGANSDQILRWVVEGLNKDFLKIVENSQATAKLVEAIKEKQASVSSGNVNNALASNTTKKVATNTFDASNYDINQVALDFMAELQQAILQVKLNLSREYERRKLEHAKSLAGQQEDLDRLTKVSQEQDKEIIWTLETMSEDGAKWKDEHLKSLQHLVDVFNQVEPQGETRYLQYIQNTLTKDKNLHALAKKSKVDLTKLIKQIRGIVQEDLTTSPTYAKKEEGNKVPVVKKEQTRQETKPQKTEKTKEPAKSNQKEPSKSSSQTKQDSSKTVNTTPPALENPLNKT